MTDMRKYKKQTNRRLLIGFVFLLLVVGDGLIYLIYGQGAAIMGLLCLMGAFIPVGFVMLYITLLDWIVKKANE